MQILKIMEIIKVEAKQKNTKEMRFAKAHVVGKVIRQGDVYIHMVDSNFKVGDEINTKQIVDGNSIGSQHVLDGDVVVYEGKKLPEWVDGRWPLGKAFDVQNRCIVTHPEHAHVNLPRGRYVVTHQIDMRTRQKIND